MKPDYSFRNINLWNIDCMKFMRDIPDNYYELAIVDPPYGIGHIKNHLHGKIKWDDNIPNDDFFIDMKRISKNQIIFGANYFNNLQGGRIVWNKLLTPKYKKTFSHCEIAYCSLQKRITIANYQWSGNVQNGSINWKNNGVDSRIHPTQKPIQLYKWLLTNYANKGDKIFDSHGGSFSLACACLDLGFSFDGTEIDKEYFDNAVKRIKNHNQEFLSL